MSKYNTTISYISTKQYVGRIEYQSTLHHRGARQAKIEDGRLTQVSAHPIDPEPSRINEKIVKGIYRKARVFGPAVDTRVALPKFSGKLPPGEAFDPPFPAEPGAV